MDSKNLTLDEVIKLAGKVADWTREVESDFSFLPWCCETYCKKIENVEIRLQNESCILDSYRLLVYSDNVKIYESSRCDKKKVKLMYRNAELEYSQKKAEENARAVNSATESVKSLLA